MLGKAHRVSIRALGRVEAAKAVVDSSMLAWRNDQPLERTIPELYWVSHSLQKTEKQTDMCTSREPRTKE